MGIGVPIIAFDSIESTNKTAAELLRLSKVHHGAVILAREQTVGRGQRDRAWTAQPGLDLTMSVVLKPAALRAEEQFVLGKLAALAVADVARAIVAREVRIKWPNDVLVERRKLAGILIKNEVVGELVQNSIVGIGLNVNSTDLPETLMATSLRLETGRIEDLTGLVKAVCMAVDRRWAQWEHAPDTLAAEYTEQLWARGRWADLLLDGQPVVARPMDVDAHGRLIVEHEDGQVKAYGLDRLRFAPR